MHTYTDIHSLRIHKEKIINNRNLKSLIYERGNFEFTKNSHDEC